MVKVGKSECEFLKWTPLSRTSAIAGAVCGVTMRPRSPSGMNRIRLRGAAFCADAAVAVSVIRLADSNAMVRRIQVLPMRSNSGWQPLPPFSFTVRQNCYRESDGVKGLSVGPGSLLLSPIVPARQRHHRPNRFDHTERPGALQKTVKRAERAGDGKTQDKLRISVPSRRNKSVSP